MKNIAKGMVVATGVMLLAFAGAATAGDGVEISPRPDAPTLRVQRTHRAVLFQRSTSPTTPIKGVLIDLRDGNGSGANALNLTQRATQLYGGWVGWVCEVVKETRLDGFVEIAVRCP